MDFKAIRTGRKTIQAVPVVDRQPEAVFFPRRDSIGLPVFEGEETEIEAPAGTVRTGEEGAGMRKFSSRQKEGPSRPERGKTGDLS